MKKLTGLSVQISLRLPIISITRQFCLYKMYIWSRPTHATPAWYVFATAIQRLRLQVRYITNEIIAWDPCMESIHASVVTSVIRPRPQQATPTPQKRHFTPCAYPWRTSETVTAVGTGFYRAIPASLWIQCGTMATHCEA